MVLRSSCAIVRTSADMSEVFPVPAYPHSRKTLRSLSDRMNSDNASMAISCSAVGVNGKLDFICEAKYLFITCVDVYVLYFDGGFGSVPFYRFYPFLTVLDHAMCFPIVKKLYKIMYIRFFILFL